MMPGRRYSEGLHQALEAKEHVKIQPENQTLASITFQNYFRLYDKLAGMTGTARPKPRSSATSTSSTSSNPDQRAGRRARTTRTTRSIRTARRSTRPSSTTSRKPHARPAGAGRHHLDREVRAMLRAAEARKGIPHKVLNARYHEQEAFIVAQAGVPGAVTIATNMAGRGTDIQLGGNADMRIAQELADITEGVRTRRAIAAIRPRSPPTSRRCWPPAASTCSAPSATKAAASTTSCAAAPAARATPAARSSSCRCKTT
jgi:preprotein translocase subunit SecA